MCPDWGRSQLRSAETSFLGKLFQKLPTMDFSVGAAKTSGFGREKTREEEGWEALVEVPHFSLPHATVAIRDARGATPRAEGGKTLLAFHIVCWKALAVILLLFQASLTPHVAPQKEPYPASQGLHGRRPSSSCSLYSPRCGNGYTALIPYPSQSPHSAFRTVPTGIRT